MTIKMGVPKFFGKWIIPKHRIYGGLLTREIPQKISSFSIDMNSLIHNVAAFCYG